MKTTAPLKCPRCKGVGFGKFVGAFGSRGPCPTCKGKGLVMPVSPPEKGDAFAHPDGTPHGADGPLGCFPCANARREALRQGASMETLMQAIGVRQKEGSR